MERLEVEVEVRGFAPVGPLYGRGRIAAPTRLPSNPSRSCWMLSPSSGIHPLKYTSAFTWSLPVAAAEMTAPP